MSWHREVLRLFSICCQAEGHQEHLYSCVSCKHFQEEMPSDTVLNKGVQGWWCKRGCQHGILVEQPGAAGSPRPSMSLSPPLEPRNAVCSQSPTAAEQCLPAGHHPQMLTPLSDSKTRAHFLHVPTWWRDLQLRPPEHIPPAPLPQAAHRAGHQSWSTNARDFISEHLTARCQRAGGVLGPALATVHVLTVLGSQHSAHGAQELVQRSVDLWGQERGVVGGHRHQEALAQQLKGKTMW